MKKPELQKRSYTEEDFESFRLPDQPRLKNKNKPTAGKPPLSLRTVVMLVAAVVFAGSLFMILNKGITDTRIEKGYTDLASAAPKVTSTPASVETLSPIDTTTPDGPIVTPDRPNDPVEPQLTTPATVKDRYMQVANVDVVKLNKTYPKLKAWMYIPGTNVNYPVMQTTDDYYLKHDYKGNNAFAGSLYMYERNSINPMDKNVTIYGHNMKNGSMFGTIKLFYLSDFLWRNSRKIYFDTIYGRYQYEIFSVYYTESTTDYRRDKFGSDKEFLDYAELLRSRSAPGRKVNIKFTPEDRILTISTCTSMFSWLKDGRMVLHARLLKSPNAATPTPTGSVTITPTPSANNTPAITPAPTATPKPGTTAKPTPKPTAAPTPKPTAKPTDVPTDTPTEVPTEVPTEEPTTEPTQEPTTEPTSEPTPDEAPT